MSQSSSSSQKEKYIWEETKEDYGKTIQAIKAEFQSRNLKSVRSNPIYQSKVIIGTKHTYRCSNDSCDFLARIIEYSAPNSIPKVEVSSNFY